MPKVPIPPDWDGQSWMCVQIQWPDSPYWVGVLSGLLWTPARGRFWDEKTGNIIETQAIGVEIADRNMPYIDCSGEPIEPPPGETGGGLIVLEGDEDMGQVVTDVYIEGGELVVEFGPCCVHRFPMGTGGEITGEVEPDIFDDHEGLTYNNCGKVKGYLDAFLAAATSMWDERDNDPSVWWNHVKADLPGYGLSLGYTMNACLAALDIQAAIEISDGVYNPDVFDATVWQSITCGLKAWLDSQVVDGQPGLPAADVLFEKVISLIDGEWTPDLLVQSFWFNVGKAVGENDLRNFALTGSTTPGLNCDCPVDPYGETPPTVAGWYWSEASSWPYTAPGGFNDFVIGVLRAAEHDIYGFAWRAEYSSGDPLLRVKRKNDATPVTGFDHFAFGTNSDNEGPEMWLIQCGDAAFAEVTGDLPDEHRMSPNFLFSDTVLTPAVDKGETYYAPVQVRADGSDPARSYGTLYFRELRNRNSPSHGA